MRYKDLLSEQQLDELRMNPSALKRFADSDEAQGILAGFEAELIFRDTQRDDDDGEMEADMDADERTRSIDNIISFFSNDDYGFGLYGRGLERLQNSLDESYYEWADNQMIDDFNREAIDQIQQWMLDNGEWDWDQATREAIEARGEDADMEAKIFELMDMKSGSERARFVEQNPEYKTAYEIYADAQVDAQNEFDDVADEHYREQDGTYDAALENYRENWEYPDQDNWLTDVGLRWMSDVANEFNLDWPIMTGGSSGGGNRSWEEIADGLQEATGQRVRVGGGYHSTPRGNYYVIEPDGSLDPDDYDDTGLEVVSPPMPLNQAIEQLQSVIEWANTSGNAYTNSSTGLHMGISIPFKGGNVDYVKLALFLGDEYVLREFGRTANTFCSSALNKLRQNVAGSRNRSDNKIASAMELLKNNLIELAQRYVQQGVGDAKYTSIHIKDGYIEFRSPGGDYLAKGDESIGILENTMRRFAYAMYLAGRPDLERKEYYKKLYKLIAPEGSDALKLFAKFATGEIDQAQLKRDWAEVQLSKEMPSERTTSQWRLYDRSTGRVVAGQEYSNFTQKDAWERARVSVDPDISIEEFQQRYELRDIGTNTGRWRAIDRGNGNTLVIVDSPVRGQAVDQIYDMLGRNAEFYVEPYSGDEKSTEPKKLTRRGELAKRIVNKGNDYVVLNKQTGQAVYTFSASGPSTAASIGMDYLRGRGLDVNNFGIQRASSPLVAQDNDRDSGQMQRRLGANQQRHNYQLYTYDEPDQVFHTMSNATADEVRAFIDQQERDGMPPGFLRVRQV